MYNEYRYTSSEPSEPEIQGFQEHKSTYDPRVTHWPTLAATAGVVFAVIAAYCWLTGTSWGTIKTPTHFDPETEERYVSPRDR